MFPRLKYTLAREIEQSLEVWGQSPWFIFFNLVIFVVVYALVQCSCLLVRDLVFERWFCYLLLPYNNRVGKMYAMTTDFLVYRVQHMLRGIHYQYQYYYYYYLSGLFILFLNFQVFFAISISNNIMIILVIPNKIFSNGI